MRLLLVSVAFCSFFNAAAAQQPAWSVGDEITYDDFVKLAPAARREKFQRLTAEHKALMMRTHAERWLTTNRARLSDAQIAVANDAIEFVTPQIYLRPNDPDILKEEQRIKQRLACILGHDNARQAFVLHAPPTQSESSTWRSVFDGWLSWFSECVVP